MADSKTPLEPNNFYHVYNHAVGNEKLFKTRGNYLFFLVRLEKYLLEFIDIYSYCLMPNHFHLLVFIKTQEDIVRAHSNTHPRKAINSGLEVPKIISRQFSHFFNSYAQAFNKENHRKGSLFYNRFKRKLIDTDLYLKNIIHYIHYNPIDHGFVDRIDDWPYSSYRTFLSTEKPWVKRKEVIELFNDMDNFIYCHAEEPDISI